MNLSEAKSLAVQTITCELDMLQMGDFECADMMLKYRKAAMLRIFIIECLNDDYATNMTVINYLFEQVKELLIMITENQC